MRGPGRRGALSEYRTTECPVVDTVTRRIEYGPPEPRDVPALMRDLVAWVHSAAARELPAVVRAGILTHRFLSIHPFDDGNGRTGRLLATTELWRSGYRMRGFLSFDEYFNFGRARYYQSLQMGLPVRYYEGRNDPDLGPWIRYFAEILASASKALHLRALELNVARAAPPLPWESLSRLQQQILTRLLARAVSTPKSSLEVEPKLIADWFGISRKTALEWARSFAKDDFLVPVKTPAAIRVRRYRLADRWRELLEKAKSTPSNKGSQARPTR